MVQVSIRIRKLHLLVNEVLQRLIEGKWTDEDIKDPLSQMINLLAEKRDRTLTQRWGIWLTKLDPEKGLKVSIDFTEVDLL